MRTVFNVKKANGFSLVELAVVVIIIGMILTMGIKMASSFQDRSAITISHSKQLAIKDALITYLSVNGRLPCPALPSALTGNEDPTTPNGACNTSIGIVPYQTLKLPKDNVIDGWDRFFTYEVWWEDTPVTYCTSVANHGNFTNDSLFLGLRTYHDGEAGCIAVKDTKIDGTLNATRYVVAVIVSHGANGFGGYSSKGVQFDYSILVNADPEKDNIAGSGRAPHTFRIEPFNDKFDDLVLEISPSDLVDPLKRDGTTVSINQLARNKLMVDKPGFVDNSCHLNSISPYIPKQTNGNPTSHNAFYPGLNIIYPSVSPVFTASTTISASEYLDSSGNQCNNIRTP